VAGILFALGYQKGALFSSRNDEMAGRMAGKMMEIRWNQHEY
jgi:hypothetical protein